MALGLLESYNRTRYVEELLERTDNQPPSLTIHLHPEYWVLNNGSKFLYHNQIASLLDDIRAHRIPVDFLDLFDNARVPFYEGCMVVELLDYRAKRSKDPQPEKPDRTRVILHPNSETVYADMCSMNQKAGGIWTDQYAFEVEAKLLLSTAPPLCLDPNPHLTRIANHVLRASTPTVPMSLKRKAATQEPEEDESEKTRRAKIMAFMTPRYARKPTPSFTLLDTVVKHKREKYVEAQREAENPIKLENHPYLNGPPVRPPIYKIPTPAPDPPKTPLHLDNRGNVVDQAKDTSSTIFVAPTYPVQFINQQAPVDPVSSGMTPQVYANVHAATEAAAAQRTATPGQPGASLTVQLQLLQKVQAHQKAMGHNGPLLQRVPIAQQQALISQLTQQAAAAQAQAQAAGSPATPTITSASPTAIAPTQGYSPTPNQYLGQQQRPGSVAPSASGSSAQQPAAQGQPPQPGTNQQTPAKAPSVPDVNVFSQMVAWFRSQIAGYQKALAKSQAQLQLHPGNQQLKNMAAQSQSQITKIHGQMQQYLQSYGVPNMQAGNAGAPPQSVAQAAVSGGVGTPMVAGQAAGRTTPHTVNATAPSVVGGQANTAPSPARGSPMATGIQIQQRMQQQQQQQPSPAPQSTIQQQQLYQRTMTPVQQQPQPQAQQPHPQLGNAQFTFATPYSPSGLRSATPSQQAPSPMAAQANLAKMNVGTPVPGNTLGSQHSPQHIHQQQVQQQQQQQLGTPRSQSQGLPLMTARMQTLTPQMQQRTPQMQQRTPLMQQQQRQPTPQQNISIPLQPQLQPQQQAQQQQHGQQAQQLGAQQQHTAQLTQQQQQYMHYQAYYQAMHQQQQAQQANQAQAQHFQGQPQQAQRMTPQQQAIWMQQIGRNAQIAGGAIMGGAAVMGGVPHQSAGNALSMQQHQMNEHVAALAAAQLANQQKR